VHSPPKLLLDFLQLRPLAVAPSLPLKLEVSPAGSTADVGKAQEREGFRSAEPAPRASGRRMASELDQAGLFRMERQRERIEPFMHRIEEATSGLEREWEERLRALDAAKAELDRRMTKLAAGWLPEPRILHPWPEQRFVVRNPR